MLLDFKSKKLYMFLDSMQTEKLCFATSEVSFDLELTIY